MKKWTKVLSAFVVATVMSAGMAAAVGCDGCGDDDKHEHSYATDWTIETDGHWKESLCGHERIGGPHEDELINGTETAGHDELCDVCGYNMHVAPEGKVIVTFYDGTTMLSSSEIDKGGKATKPATDPKKDGHTFDGWYADAAFKTPFDFNTALNANTPVYAKFTPNSNPPAKEYWTVTVDLNDGSTPVEKQVEKGEKITDLKEPTRDGYKFTGWKVNGEDWTADTAVTANITIVAQWESTGTEENTIYKQLVDKGSLYHNDFTTGSTVDVHSGYGSAAGVYMSTDGAASIVDGAVKHTSGKGANSDIIVDFGPLAPESEVEGFMKVKVSAVGSAWNLVQFKDSSAKTVFAIGAGTDKAKIAYVAGSGICEKLDGKTNTNVAGAVVTAITFDEKTTYEIYYKIDMKTGAVTLNINGTDISVAEAGVTDVAGITLTSSNSGARLVTVDDVVFCGTKMTADDYRATAQAKIDAAYVKMVGKDAVGTEGEEGYVPAVVGTHVKNTAAIKAAYDAIDLSAITDIDELNGKVAEFVALQTTYDADTAIDAAIAKYATDLAAVKEAKADDYTENATAFNALFTEYEAVDFTAATSVKTVTDKYAEFEGKLAEIDDDATVAANALAAAKATAIETVNAAKDGVTDENIIAEIEGLQTAALAEIDAAETEAEVNAIMTKFNGDVAAAKLSSDIAGYKTQISDNIAAYADGKKENLDSTEDETLISAIDGVVEDAQGKVENAEDKAGVDAVKTAAELAIEKLIAIDSLDKDAAAKSEDIQNKVNASIIAINSAIGTAKSEGESAIEDAADKNAVTAALNEAKGNIATEYNKLPNVDLEITINGVTGVTATAKYGQTVVIDTSNLAETVMIKGWYTDSDKAEDHAFDLATLLKDDIRLYADTEEAVSFNVTNTFKWSDIKGVAAKSKMTNEDFTGSNDFIKVKTQDSVEYRDETDGGTSSKKVNFIQISGEALQFEFKGTGTLKVTLRGTGSSAHTAISLKSGNVSAQATYGTQSDTTVKVYDNNVYDVVSKDHYSITFNITQPGTYVLCTNRIPTLNGEEVTYQDNDKDIYGAARISGIVMNDNYKEKANSVTGVSITNENVSVNVGKNVTLGYDLSAEDSEKAPNNVAKIEWSVNEAGAEYLEINKDTGVIKGLKATPAENNPVVITVTVTANDGETTYTDTITVTVVDVLLESVSIKYDGDVVAADAEAIEVAAGDINSITLEYVLNAEDGSNEPTDVTDVVWSVDEEDEKYVTVSANGVVTGVSPCQNIVVTVTANLRDGGTKTATVKITVPAVAAEGISLKDKETVSVDKTVTLTPVITPAGASGYTVEWSSSDTEIATVNADGVVTGKAMGFATITATLKVDGETIATADCAVTVNKTQMFDLDELKGKVAAGKTTTSATTIGDFQFVDGKLSNKTSYISLNLNNNAGGTITFKTTTDNAKFTIKLSSTSGGRSITITGLNTPDPETQESKAYSHIVDYSDSSLNGKDETFALGKAGDYTLKIAGGEIKFYYFYIVEEPAAAEETTPEEEAAAPASYQLEAVVPNKED